MRDDNNLFIAGKVVVELECVSAETATFLKLASTQLPIGKPSKAPFDNANGIFGATAVIL